MGGGRHLRIFVALSLAALGGSLACRGGDPNHLRFGLVVPVSGELEVYGESIRRGVEIAAEGLRSDPSFTKTLEILERDSEGDPGRAAAALEELYELGVTAVIGGVTSGEALAMVPVADRYNRVLLSPSASSAELSGISRNFFRVFPSDSVEGTKMGSFAGSQLGLSTAVVLATATPYGRGIGDIFAAEFRRHGGEVLGVQEFPSNTGDLSGIVDWVLGLEPQPDAAYIAAFWDEIVRLLEGLREGGFEGRLLTTSAFATPRSLEAAGPAAERVLFTQTVFEVDSSDEPLRSFVTEYRARFDDDPDLYAAHGYDALAVLVEADHRAHSSLASDFYKGMIDLHTFPGVTGSLQFTERGEVTKFPRVYAIRDGVALDYGKVLEIERTILRKRLDNLEREKERLRRGRG